MARRRPKARATGFRRAQRNAQTAEGTVAPQTEQQTPPKAEQPRPQQAEPVKQAQAPAKKAAGKP